MQTGPFDREEVLAGLGGGDSGSLGLWVWAWVGPLQGGPEPLLALLADAPEDTRRKLYRAIRRRRRTDLADEFVDQVRERYGDREAASLLPVCGEATVTRLLPELGYALDSLTAIARHHPDLVLELAAGELAPLSGDERDQWWSRGGGAVLAAAERRPEQTLDLLERYAPSGHLPHPLSAYGLLAKTDPVRVLGLLTAPRRAGWVAGTHLPAALLDRLARMAPVDLPGLPDLVRRLSRNVTALARLLAAAPPRHRAELFTLALSDVDRSRELTNEAILDVLPMSQRTAEARRVLALEEVRQDERLTLHYTGYLPWSEAEPALLAATRSADADDRARAWRQLVRCAARSDDPAAVRAVVEHLLRLRNERDSVRGAAFAALARVPGRLLGDELAAQLDRLVTDGVEARDSSSETLSQLTTLAATVLRERFDSPPLVGWARHTFERVLGDDRVPDLGHLASWLRRGQEAQVFEAVRGWLVDSADRAKYAPLFAVTRALGRRAHQLPELQALLARAVGRDNLPWVARTAVELWLDDRRHRAERVGAVLREDPSAVALDTVWQAVCVRRRDLLDEILGGPPPTGRFVPGGVLWTPGRPVLVRHWEARHRRAYVDRMTVLAADTGHTWQSRATALRWAALVPDYGWPLVRHWAGATDVNIAESALAALAWTDRPADALAILLSHVDGDRARVAVYAATRAARFVAPSTLRERLDPSRGKVTTRKEIVRLIAHLSVPGAEDAMWALWQDPGEHRDVRAAVVATARQWTDRPGMWRILRSAAADGTRETAVPILAAHPAGIRPDLRGGYAQLVGQLCRSGDRQLAIEAWRAFPRWVRWLPGAAGALIARLRDLDDRTVWPAVADALVAVVTAGHGETLLAEALGALTALDEAPAGGLDRPARRRVEAIVTRLAGRGSLTVPVRATLGTAAEVLSAVDGFAPQAARLLAAAIDPADAADVAQLRDLVAERPVLAARIARELPRRLGEHEPELLRPVAAELARQPRVADGLLALAYAEQGARLHWPEPWRAIVVRLRAHPAPEVRDAALELSLDR
ncbi:hypothetical protein GCM10022255_055620 [Dactylosporangium darangshiense]|uniref:Uncharacterized protein n=1 Tax=Dactylosporangium darangshiense TaxID=579108 RepID=A0ABP8DE31_9ACTN